MMDPPRLQVLTDAREREGIRRTLTECEGQKSEVGRWLGMSCSAFHKKYLTTGLSTRLEDQMVMEGMNRGTCQSQDLPLSTSAGGATRVGNRWHEPTDYADPIL